MSILEEECCICGAIAKSPYSMLRHMDNGKTRIYSGHKSCLSYTSIDSLILQGKEPKYSEFDSSELLKGKDRDRDIKRGGLGE